MPDWLSVVLLGVIEGVTEFMPVSSTGHLVIAEHWLKAQTELFNVVIQCGAVVAVILVFQGRLRHLVSHWRDASARNYLLKLATAFVVTGAGGVVLKTLGFTLSPDPLPVALATLIGGVLFLVVEWWLRQRTPREEVTWAVAAALGAAQLVAAIFPGTSRSGVTILLALAVGLSRPAATEFSFLLGVPTLLAAGALELWGEFRHPSGTPVDWGMLALGTAVSAVTAFGVVRWLLRFVQTHTFNGFAWYRIVLGGLILWLA